MINSDWKRVALIFQYDGTNFSGWQKQKQVNTIQGTIEKAIETLSSSKVKTFASGRTDAGVHAAGQVLHFDTNCVIPPQRWADALNGKLPNTIRIIQSVEVSKEWHACYSAQYRHYRYLINNSKIPNIFLNNWSWHRYQKPLDCKLMKQAVIGMEGEHDFFAFQKNGSNRLTSITTIKEIKIENLGEIIFLDIKATGFLYGMVRAIVGQLVLVGEKKISPKSFYQRWSQRKKEEVHESAPAKGLCFINSVYKDNIFCKCNTSDFFPKFIISGNS